MKEQIKRYWRAIFGDPTDKSDFMIYKIKEIPCFEDSPTFIAFEYLSTWFTGYGRYNILRKTFESKIKGECLKWIEWRKNKPSVKVENI